MTAYDENAAVMKLRAELADEAEKLIGKKIAHIEHHVYAALPRDYRSGWREGLQSLRDELRALISGVPQNPQDS